MSLIVRPDNEVALLPPMLFPPAAYYAVSARYRRVAVDCGMRYDKRFKCAHRFDIADTRGRLTITVPVSRPKDLFAEGNLRWNRILVSDHNHWWANALTSLESAYGRTPFFEFYIDRFLPLFAPRPLAGERPETVTDLVCRADRLVRSILCPESQTVYCVDADSLTASETEVADFRRADFTTLFTPAPYYQVRADRLGFIAGLSVLDLVFNMGPEAPLWLR